MLSLKVRRVLTRDLYSPIPDQQGHRVRAGLSFSTSEVNESQKMILKLLHYEVEKLHRCTKKYIFFLVGPLKQPNTVSDRL